MKMMMESEGTVLEKWLKGESEQQREEEEKKKRVAKAAGTKKGVRVRERSSSRNLRELPDQYRGARGDEDPNIIGKIEEQRTRTVSGRSRSTGT